MIPWIEIVIALLLVCQFLSMRAIRIIFKMQQNQTEINEIMRAEINRLKGRG